MTQTEFAERIRYYERAVSQSPPRSLLHTANLGALTSMWTSKAIMTDHANDIDAAIPLLRQCVQDHSETYRTFVRDLGWLLLTRYDRISASMTDLNEAVSILEYAIRILVEDVTSVHLLSKGLRYRYQNTGSRDDLHRALRLSEQATASLHPADTWHSFIRLNFVALLRLNYEERHCVDDLNRAIIVSEDALQSLPDGDSNRWAWVLGHGMLLGHRYELTGM